MRVVTAEVYPKAGALSYELLLSVELAATIRCTDSCAAEKPGANARLFCVSAREGEREGDDVEPTDRETGETEDLSALQPGKDGRDSALPPLPLSVTGPHAPPAGRHRPRARRRRDRSPSRRRQLLRHALQVDPHVRWRARAVN